MKTEALKAMVVMMLLVLALLYVGEWLTFKRPAPVVPKPTNASTNALSFEVREHLAISLDHVRSEITHTTNQSDISVLRQMEAILTNVLAHP